MYRTIDGEGGTLDIQSRQTCNHKATYMLMKRFVEIFGEPSVLTVDKVLDLLYAFEKL
nr:hypothetical protein GGBNIMDK_00077 [Bacillus cereus]